MNTVSAFKPSVDPYFHDIIREMEALPPKASESDVGRRQFLKIAGGARHAGLGRGQGLGRCGIRTSSRAMTGRGA